MVKWIAPTLSFPPAPSNGYGHGGCGAGAPVVGITISAFTVPDASPVDTVVGTFTVDPSDTTLSLVSNPGGFFKIVSGVLKTTSTPLDAGINPVIHIVVRGVWAGKITDKAFDILVTPYVLQGVGYTAATPNSGGEAFVLTAAAQGTDVATLDPYPTPPGSKTLTYELDTGNTSGHFQIVGAKVQASATPNTLGTYTVWFWGKVDGVRIEGSHGRMNVQVGATPS